MRKIIIGTGLIALIGALAAAVQLTAADAAPSLDGMVEPAYTADGDLIRPEDYRTWVFVGASLGLSYDEDAAEREGPGAFTNVYIQPEAYRYFMATGEFPEGTMLPMDVFGPGSASRSTRAATSRRTSWAWKSR